MRVVQTVVLVAALVMGVSLPAQVRAEEATPDEMEQICRNWLSYMVHQAGDWAGETEPSITGVRPLTAGDTLLALCYSIRPHGHVVVPVLKELPPVKAYSETHGMDPDQTGGYTQLLRDVLHDRMTRFIDAYGGLDVRQPTKGDLLFDPVNRAEWDRYLMRDADFRSLLDGGAFAPLTEVGPLLTTQWHQFEPYNNYCPMGDGDRCVVGCLITATTQIMNYHEWPPMGKVTFTRYWNGDNSCGGSTPGDTLYADLTDPYDWANMADSCYYGGEINECVRIESDALAELNYEVGVALMVDYGACGTAGAYTDVTGGLPFYFKYAWTIDDEFREDYTAETWFEAIQTELNQDRPILYLIMGHAIVCDGWRDTGGENQYHMNYGWGGGHSGWYAIDNLYMSHNPMYEAMIREIRPRLGWIRDVEADGSGEYATIQAAVDAAGQGDVILLADGVYSGAGNRDVDFGGKLIAVLSGSKSPDACVIDCEGLGRGFLFQSGEGPGSSLEGITIINGLADHGGAVYCNSSGPTITRCVFYDNSATQSGGGMYCTGGSSADLLQCTFTHNDAGGQGGGIACDGASLLDVDHTIVTFSTAGEAVYCDGGGAATLLCCDVYGNGGGDWVGCIAGQEGANGNFSDDPDFCDPPNADFSLAEYSPCTYENSGPECGWIGALRVGCTGTPVVLVEESGVLELGLLANVPNPFNPTTTISYSVPAGAEASRVTLCVYNCLGQRVRTLVDAEQPGGTYAVGWDGTDEGEKQVASGVYFYRIAWSGESETRRMVLLK